MMPGSNKREAACGAGGPGFIGVPRTRAFSLLHPKLFILSNTLECLNQLSSLPEGSRSYVTDNSDLWLVYLASPGSLGILMPIWLKTPQKTWSSDSQSGKALLFLALGQGLWTAASQPIIVPVSYSHSTHFHTAHTLLGASLGRERPLCSRHHRC